MPLYEYMCEQCGPFTELRRMSECELTAECPDCNAEAARMISAPRLAIMETNNRVAWERNERSAHEPRQITRSNDHHGHDHKGKHNHAHHHAHQHGHGGGRPWMLGH